MNGPETSSVLGGGRKKKEPRTVGIGIQQSMVESITGERGGSLEQGMYSYGNLGQKKKGNLGEMKIQKSLEVYVTFI